MTGPSMLTAMLRAALLACLLAAAFCQGDGDLSQILQQGEIQPAIQLMMRRYRGISQPAASAIIWQMITAPIPTFLVTLNGFDAVPSLSSGQRFSYLQTYVSDLPKEPFYLDYSRQLVQHLRRLGIGVTPVQLTDSLALIDYYCASHRVQVASRPLFHEFYSSYMLGQSGRVSSFTFPPLSQLVSRLQEYTFPGKYFKASRGPATVVARPNPSAYNGPGAPFLAVFKAVGLPNPEKPEVSLRGLKNFVDAQEIQFPAFVAAMRGARRLADLVRSINIMQYRSYLTLLQIDDEQLIERDVIPLLAARFLAFPDRVRASFKRGSRNLDFKDVLRAYFDSPNFRDAGRQSTTFTPGLVTAILTGFDRVARATSSLPNYRGPWWLPSLYPRNHPFFKRGRLVPFSGRRN